MRKEKGWWMALGASIFSLAVLFPPLASATHELDHRFTVFGYVRDDNGRPIKGERVIVVDERLDLGNTAFSDGDGYYEALLHLHNDSMGDEIVVMVGDERKTLRATFDPEDTKTERRVQIDFGAPPSKDVNSDNTVLRYGVAGALVAGIALVIIMKRSKTRSRKDSGKGSKKKK